MTKQEYDKITNTRRSNDLITINDLINKEDRTLLYGYLCDRSTFHVYIKEEEIFVVRYGYEQKPKLCEVAYNEYYVPDKRLYPECCDYEFCKLLIERGISLPFTTPNFSRDYKKYYGETI